MNKPNNRRKSRPDCAAFLRGKPTSKLFDDKLHITTKMLQHFEFLAQMRLEFINKGLYSIEPEQETHILMEEIFMYIDAYKPFIRKMIRPLNNELYTIYNNKEIEYEILPPKNLIEKYEPILERLIFGESFKIDF